MVEAHIQNHAYLHHLTAFKPWISPTPFKCDISRFFPRIDRIFPGEALNPFLVLKMKDFRNFVLDNCILDFDAEQVYLKPQGTLYPLP